MQRMRVWAAAAAIWAAAGATLAPPAAAEVPDLRFSLAKLIESLEAGLSPADLHGLRIEIGAEIRLQGSDGMNAAVHLSDYAQLLAAADHAWAVLGTAPSCQIDHGALRDAAACHSMLDPLYHVMQMPPPELSSNPNPPALVRDILKTLQHQSETVLHSLQ